MKTETYPVIQGKGGKFHRPAQTEHPRMAWLKPMATKCGHTVTPLNVFDSERGAVLYAGGSRAHLCRFCFPDDQKPE
jgi:hypothetical protein